MRFQVFPRVSICRLAIAFLFAGVSTTIVNGQEVQVFGFESSSGGDVPKGGNMQIAIGGPGGVALNSGMAMGGGMFGVDPNNRSALFNLLSNDSVRRELQLNDDQSASVQKIQQDGQKRMSELVRANMASGSPNPVANLRELMEENRKTSEAAIEEILLPEQLTRVRQLAYQVEIAQLGLGESLISGRLGKEIDVHDDQKQHLIDKASAIEIETRIAIGKIRAAARDKLLAELVPEQRKKAENLLGPHFDYEEPSFAKSIRQRFKQAEQTKK